MSDRIYKGPAWQVAHWLAKQPLTREWDDEDAVEATRQEFSCFANGVKEEEKQSW